MTEDFTSQAIAYLLDELQPAARVEFEGRLATDPGAAAELNTVAHLLATFATASAPAEPLPAAIRNEMAEAVAQRTRPPARGWAKAAWPLAAAVLLGLNVAQWLAHRSPAARSANLDSVARPPIAPVNDGASAVGVARHSAQPLHLAPRHPPGPAAASIRQTLTVAIAQSATVTRSSAAPVARGEDVPQQGAIELRNLPHMKDDRRLYLWVQRAGAEACEPVGEIPRQLYGTSGIITYQLRAAPGAAVRFVVTIEAAGNTPSAPSPDVVCSGP